MMIFQNATELMAQRLKTAKWDHALELMDQKMDQLVPHASELSQLLSHTITKTQLPETHTMIPETLSQLTNNTQLLHGLETTFNLAKPDQLKPVAQRKLA